MRTLEDRFRAACSDLYKDMRRGFDSGSNLVGIIELPSGKSAQIHVTMLTDENEFIDPDGPTGCADDLITSVSEFGTGGSNQ